MLFSASSAGHNILRRWLPLWHHNFAVELWTNNMKANKPHFHVWVMPRGSDRMMYRWARGFPSQPAAHQYAARRFQDDPDRFIVRKCSNPKCAPKLD